MSCLNLSTELTFYPDVIGLGVFYSEAAVVILGDGAIAPVFATKGLRDCDEYLVTLFFEEDLTVAEGG